MDIHRPNRKIVIGNRTIYYSSLVSKSEISLYNLENYLDQHKMQLSDIYFELYLLINKNCEETVLSKHDTDSSFLTSTQIFIKTKKDYTEADFNERTHFYAVEVLKKDFVMGESRIPYKIEDDSRSESDYMSVRKINEYGIPSEISFRNAVSAVDFSFHNDILQLNEKLRFVLKLSKRLSWKDKALLELRTEKRLKSWNHFYYRTVYESDDQLKPGDVGYLNEIEKAKKLLGLS